MRTKLIAITILLLLAFFGGNLAQAQTLVIWQKDGGKVYYSLDDQPKTTFTTDELVITTKSATVNYPLSQILRYTYESGSVGIENVHIKGVTISHHGDEIIVIGLPSNKALYVYGVDGKLLLSKRSDGATRFSLSLSQLPTGVYVITADTINYKFIKR